MIDEFAALALLLHTDPADIGCGQAMTMLHVYADLGSAGKAKYPGVAAHLAACGPCSDDLNGLLAAMDASD